MIYVPVKTLPAILQYALENAGYHRTDIGVNVRETAYASSHSGDGMRAFTVLVDLETGHATQHWGSWGGANMFTPNNPVDGDTTPRQLPPDGAVINGHTGGGKPAYASLTVHPSRAARLLPSPVENLSERDRKLLGVYASLNSAGRKQYFERHPSMRPTATDLQSLADRGFIKVSKAGAVTITADGRNNADRNIGY